MNCKLLYINQDYYLIDKDFDLKQNDLCVDGYKNIHEFVDLSNMGVGYDKKNIHKIIGTTCLEHISPSVKFLINSEPELHSLLIMDNLGFHIKDEKIRIKTLRFEDVAYLYKRVPIVIDGYSELITDPIYLDGINYVDNTPIVKKIHIGWDKITPILRSINSITYEESKFAGDWNEEFTLEEIRESIKTTPYFLPVEFKWLLDNKFDLFFLIENGEAIEQIS